VSQPTVPQGVQQQRLVPMGPWLLELVTSTPELACTVLLALVDPRAVPDPLGGCPLRDGARALHSLRCSCVLLWRCRAACTLAELLRGTRRPFELAPEELARLGAPPHEVLERIDAAHGPRVPEDFRTLGDALRDAEVRQGLSEQCGVAVRRPHTIRVGPGTHRVSTTLELCDGVHLVGGCPAGQAVVEVAGCVGLRSGARGSALVNLRIRSAPPPPPTPPSPTAALDAYSGGGGGGDGGVGQRGWEEEEEEEEQAQAQGVAAEEEMEPFFLDEDSDFPHDGIHICGGDLQICDCDISFAAGAGVVVRPLAGGAEEVGGQEEGGQQGSHRRPGGGERHPFDSASPPRLLRTRVHDGGDTGVFVADSCCQLIECTVAAHQLSNIEIKGCLPGTVLRGCCIEGGEEAGLHIYDGGAALIEHTSVRGSGMAGVAVRDGSCPRLRHCVLEHGYEGGCMAMGEDTLVDLTDCVVRCNAETGAEAKDGARLTLRRCALIGNGTTGLLCRHHARVELGGCVLARNGLAAVEVREAPPN
jgi:hypothetical protein